MNGADHYREAERLLSGQADLMANAERARMSMGSLTSAMSLTTAQAQVHATLAQAAATYERPVPLPDGSWSNAATHAAWVNVLKTPAPDVEPGKDAPGAGSNQSPP